MIYNFCFPKNSKTPLLYNIWELWSIPILISTLLPTMWFTIVSSLGISSCNNLKYTLIVRCGENECISCTVKLLIKGNKSSDTNTYSIMLLQLVDTYVYWPMSFMRPFIILTSELRHDFSSLWPEAFVTVSIVLRSGKVVSPRELSSVSITLIYQISKALCNGKTSDRFWHGELKSPIKDIFPSDAYLRNRHSIH